MNNNLPPLPGQKNQNDREQQQLNMNNFQRQMNYSAMDQYRMEQQGRTYALDEATMTEYLHRVMSRVYLKMTIGLIITALVGYFMSQNETIMRAIFSNQVLFWGILIAELAVVFVVSGMINKLSTGVAAALFYLYAALNGVVFSVILLGYTGESIALTFFVTAGTFAAMSIYGYTTKANLHKFGSYLFMALIGIIIASLVNWWLKSSGLELIISILGVLIFVGLTAWDTQKIKQMAMETDEANTGKLATLGALSLYLDFVNLFLYLLRFLGRSR